MQTFNADPVQEMPLITPHPFEGPNFQPNQDIAYGLLYNQKHYDFVKATVDEMLAKSGIEVEKVEGTDFAAPTEATRNALSGHIDLAKAEVQEIYDLSNEMLPGLKNELATGLGAYAEELGIGGQTIEQMIAERIKGVNEVRMDDLLTQNRSYRFSNAIAVFSTPDNILKVMPDKVRAAAKEHGWTPEVELRRDVLHELMHAASYRSWLPDIEFNVGVGLGIKPATNEANTFRTSLGSLLLEEGAQEHIRWRKLDGTFPAYEKSVLFWEAALALDPSLEKDRFNAKFLNKDRGVMMGKIENIFGPNAVEIIEDEMDGYNRLRDYPDWKDKLIDMIEVHDADPVKRAEKTEAARLKARKAMDDAQSEILEQRGLELSDDDLRYAKEHDGILPTGVHIENLAPRNNASKTEVSVSAGS